MSIKRNHRAAAMLAAIGLVATASACSLPAHIDDALFAQLSVDRKLLLFDAENEVSAAQDGQQQMREHWAALREQRRMAIDETRWAEAQSRELDSEEMRQNALQAAKTWRLRERYLLESSAYLRQRINVQARVIDAAQARFELQKAQQAQAEKLLSQDKVNLPRFVAQVTRFCAARDKALQGLVPRQQACERARQAWLSEREVYVAHNIQRLGMVGADEVPVWELR